MLRMTMVLRAAYKMVDTCAAEFEAETPYYYSGMMEVKTKQKRQLIRRRFWYLVLVQSVSDRVSSLTTVLYTVHGHLKKGLRDNHRQQ